MIDDNTLVIFTGDNGTGGQLTARVGDFRLRGGKRTMNEAGTRVPFITLMDMLPTLASVANISVKHNIDGMDLSHNLFNKSGKDRQYFSMAFEGGCYFIRDPRFRLHEDGRLYDVPVTGNETRYGMNVLGDSAQHDQSRSRLQRKLKEFMAIKQTDNSYQIIPFGTGGDNFKNAQDRAGSRKRKVGKKQSLP